MAAALTSPVYAKLRGALTPSRWPSTALLASAFMLAAAHGFQAIGYPPCSLCLRQREVYWLIIALCAAALAAKHFKPSQNLARIFAFVIGIAFLLETGIAAFHAGIEWKFWPGPATCTGGGGHLPADLSRALEGPQIVVMCDEAAWRVLGLSMPGYNALIALGLAALSCIAARAPLPSKAD